MAEITRVTQSGLNVLAEGEPDIRVTQSGLNVVARTISPLRVTQTGLNVVGSQPTPQLTATAVSSTQIDLTMGAGPGATVHQLYRSITEGFSPGPATLIATYGAVPPAGLADTGRTPGRTYYYALVATAGAAVGTARAAATTPGVGDVPNLRVGAVLDTEATLSVDQLSEYLTVRYRTRQIGITVDLTDLTGSFRYFHTLLGLTPELTYTAQAQVRYAAGWSDWSDEVEWTMLPLGGGVGPELGCPPTWSGIHVNSDANPPTNRLGVGWQVPQPGQPLRGQTVLVFRWPTSEVRWNFELSDDLGATYPVTVEANVGPTGIDGDRLIRYTATLNTTLYADDMDYRLRAVSQNTADDDVESLSFPIDNAGDVHWWKQTADALGPDWGALWATTQDRSGEGIWVRGSDGGIGALRGHDPALLASLVAGRCLGADITVRMYIWSGEGGMFQGLQGRNDTEAIMAGIGLFGEGVGEDNRTGIMVSVGNLITFPLGCCDDYLTSTGASLDLLGSLVAGGGAPTAIWGQLVTPSPLEKMFFKATQLPMQLRFHFQYLPPELRGPQISLENPWPLMSWREGPTTGEDIRFGWMSCARRFEMYALRVRAELDPGDDTRLRIRTRLDGLGVEPPAASYWHGDQWITKATPWAAGHVGLMSQQDAAATYGQPQGARVFLSSSILPISPSPSEIEPVVAPPWNPPVEGEPCTLVLQIFNEDRETVRWEVGTDQFHPSPYLCIPEHYGEQELDVVKGAATIAQVEVVVIDKNPVPGDQDGGWLTDRLSIGSVGAIHGRRNRLIRFISPELGWVVIADGPASTPEMDESYSAFRWVIRDTRETERKVKAFVRADTCWLFPMGVPAGFGAYQDENGADQWLVPPQAPLIGDYIFDVGDPFPVGSVNFRANYWSGVFGPGNRPVDTEVLPDVVVTAAVEEAMLADAEELGDPRPVLWTWPELEILWRISGSGDPWTIVQPTDLLVEGRSIAKPTGSGAWWRTLLTVFGSELGDGTPVRAGLAMTLRGYQATGTFPADGDEIEVAVRYLGPPTEAFPLHIQNLTSGQLIKRLYDGQYSARDPVTDEVVPTGIRYDVDDLLMVGGGEGFLSLGATDGLIRLEDGTGSLLLTVAEASEDTVLLRQTEVVDDLRDWVEENLYSPTGWCPALNNDGEISPRSQVPPLTFEGLTDINNAITEPQPDWDAGERIINVLTYNYPRWLRVELEDAEAIDLLEKRDITIEYRDEASITRHGLRNVTYDGSAFSAVGDTTGNPIVALDDEQSWILTQLRRLYVFDRYRNAAPILNVPVRRDYTATLRAGDWVTLDLSWFPDYVTDRRGLITGGQILAIHDVDCEWRILLIEEALPVIEES